jgi:CheY-like chemotaxis protein
MKGRILFLDDDVFQTKYNVEVLRKDFDVERHSEVDRALRDFAEIKQVQGPWAGAVLDLMMPPGKFASASPDGTETGWHVFKALREIQPNLPVIIMTNLNQNDIRSWFRNETNVRTFDKVAVLPDELLQIANQFFSRSSAAES